MRGAAADNETFFTTVVFLNRFNDLLDPRQRGNIVHPLDEILLLAFLAVLAGADSFVEIARFGEKTLDLLRRFRPFSVNTPPHDHLGDIFAALDAGQFQRCFVAWVASLTDAPEGVVAIDVKPSAARAGRPASAPFIWYRPSSRANVLSSDKRKSRRSPTRSSRSRGCWTCGRSSRRRPIISLDCKAIRGHCAKMSNGSYLSKRLGTSSIAKISRAEIIDADNDRSETRVTTVIHDVEWLRERHDWAGLNTVAIVESTRETKRKIERAARYKERSPYLYHSKRLHNLNRPGSPQHQIIAILSGSDLNRIGQPISA
jgi:hypothetical protein